MQLSPDNKQLFVPRNRLFVLLVAIGMVSVPSVAQDADQELFNQLYREIVSSSAGKTILDDTSAGGTGVNTVPTAGTADAVPGSDKATELLQGEIDKMVDDARLRHGDAVRFMQDIR